MASFFRISPLTGKYTCILKFRAAVLLATGFLATTILSGCGIGKATESTPQSGSGMALSGKTFGGPNPIVSSTVKLYTTGNSSGASSGYGVATLRQTTTTNSGGGFNLASGYACPAGQFAYIVAAGGNTGAGSSTSASGATATANWDGITAIAVTAGGTGYVSPTVTINDPTGTGATATATVATGVITKITVVTQGNGYTSPTVSITDSAGINATATATAGTGGAITGATVTSGGSGYLTTTVTVTPSDGLGTGATAAAGIGGSGNTTGAITSVSITNPGSGYDAPPTITITPTSSPTNTNNNAVLVAALGRCEDLYTGGAYTGSNIYVSELSTIAAAYALGHFTTVSGSGASTVVSIGSSATNNAAQISGFSTGCVAGVSTCTTTATAGLAHAFQNAANLVNVFQNPISNNGANSTVAAPPGTTSFYSNGSYAAAKPLVPQALINSLGNSLVACVNSAGGVAGDGSPCGNIFTWTTLPSAISAVIANAGNSYSTTAPTNTFQAMVNLAAYPTVGSTSTVANLYNLASGFTSVYSPALTASPAQDWTIAINYPESITGTTPNFLGTGVGNTTAGSTSWCATAPCQGLGFTPSGAVDINDVFYVGNNSTIPSGAVPTNIVSFASNGQLLGMTPNNTTLKNVAGLSVDALGWGYYVTGGASGTNNFAYFKTGGGSIGTLTGGGAVNTLTQKNITPSINLYGTAIDLQNNVWVAGASATVYQLSQSSTGPVTPTAGQTFTLSAALAPNTTVKNLGIQMDPSQNLWLTNGATGVVVLQNTGTVGSPTYASASTTSGTTTITPTTGIAFVGNEAFVAAYNGTPTGIQPFTPTLSGATATSIAPQTATTGGTSVITGADLLEADGTGQLWVANYNNSSITELEFQTPYTTGTGYRIIPCVSATASATTCTTGFASTFKPQFVAIDSAGSIWAGAGGNSSNVIGGSLIEIIGSAAPTVPLISLGKQGSLP